MNESLILKIESCRDCPRLKIRDVHHWLLGNQLGYEYRCTKKGKIIMPKEGVKPPPQWCLLRTESDTKDD